MNTIQETKFKMLWNTHHNPHCDIVVKYLDKDSYVTYVFQLNNHSESLEYYRGSNYRVDSKLRSYSRRWEKERIPKKFQTHFNEMKDYYFSVVNKKRLQFI